jgi:precorrin-6B methylase 2
MLDTTDDCGKPKSEYPSGVPSGDVPVADFDSMIELHLLTDIISPWAVRVAATLRLADIVAEGVSRLDELAAAAGANPDSLGRLLRFLTCRGVFRESAPGEFALTPSARLLMDSHPAGLRAWFDLEGAEGRMSLAWAGLLDAVRSGQPSYPRMFGLTFWDDLDASADLAASFGSLMAASTSQLASDILAGYEWTGVRHVVDIGGGTGTLLVEILRAHPSVRGTLIELPATASVAFQALDVAGLMDRCDVVTTSFFDPLPRGGDVYLLSWVLHDWSDRDAAAILRRCAEAAEDAGRVLVIEGILGSNSTQQAITAMDLRMLVLLGGRERTLEEFNRLAATAGLTLQSVRSTIAGRSILEYMPAPSTVTG